MLPEVYLRLIEQIFKEGPPAFFQPCQNTEGSHREAQSIPLYVEAHISEHQGLHSECYSLSWQQLRGQYYDFNKAVRLSDCVVTP